MSKINYKKAKKWFDLIVAIGAALISFFCSGCFKHKIKKNTNAKQ